MDLIGFTGLIGGLAIFLYGMAEARDSLQLVAGSRLRSIISAVTERRLLGLMTGVVVTVFLQSSSATTVMLVSFVSTGLMSLAQAMAVTLGAGIGTTVTVQIISFKLSKWALLLVAVGVAIVLGARRRRARYVGQLILAFGFIFFGMRLMGDATAPLKDTGAFEGLLRYLGENQIAAFIAAAGFTAIVQASAATIGLLLGLAVSGIITLELALPLVLGANVGTAITAILAALGAPPEGKQVAVGHLFYKVIAGAVGLALLGPLEQVSRWSSGDLARQIANAHTVFNLAASLAFLPFTGLAARLLQRLYQPEAAGAEFRPKYLDKRALETPVLAFGQAHREFLRMADIVHDMFRKVLPVFELRDPDLIAEIEALDDHVDILNREIKLYLTRLTQRDLTSEEADQELELVTLAAELENAGDVINRNILSMAQKYLSHQLTFSEEGWAEIADLHGKVAENFDLALLAFSTRNEELARKVMRHAANFERIEVELRQAHLVRLHQAVPAAFETSAIHMDLITYLVRVNAHVARMANSVLQDVTRRDILENA